MPNEDDNVRSISDRAANGEARTGSAVDPQDGLFDHTWDDGDLVADLEAREEARIKKLDANADFRQADEKVKNRLLNYHLEDGEVARCGRFRIKKSAIPGGSEVAFTTQPRTQMRIGTLGD